MWGGCFADHGINAGDGGFEVKLATLSTGSQEPEENSEKDSDAALNTDPIAACRIGWTVQEMV